MPREVTREFASDSPAKLILVQPQDRLVFICLFPEPNWSLLLRQSGGGSRALALGSWIAEMGLGLRKGDLIAINWFLFLAIRASTLSKTVVAKGLWLDLVVDRS